MNILKTHKSMILHRSKHYLLSKQLGEDESEEWLHLPQQFQIWYFHAFHGASPKLDFSSILVCICSSLEPIILEIFTYKYIYEKDFVVKYQLTETTLAIKSTARNFILRMSNAL